MSGKPDAQDARIVALEERIGHRFKRRAVLREALTHGSALDGGSKRRRSYQRLEFLGDRVLGLIVAQHLLEAHKDEDEGELAPRFNALVNRHACARAARRADLGAAVIMSSSEASNGGRGKETILADLCESIIAALYLDAGLDAARAFITRFWEDEFDHGEGSGRDPKTVLQEWAAAKRRDITYETLEQRGTDHEPIFVIELRVVGFAPVRGEGGSKRDGQRAAAAAFLSQRGVDV